MRAFHRANLIHLDVLLHLQTLRLLLLSLDLALRQRRLHGLRFCRLLLFFRLLIELLLLLQRLDQLLCLQTRLLALFLHRTLHEFHSTPHISLPLALEHAVVLLLLVRVDLLQQALRVIQQRLLRHLLLAARLLLALHLRAQTLALAQLLVDRFLSVSLGVWRLRGSERRSCLHAAMHA